MTRREIKKLATVLKDAKPNDGGETEVNAWFNVVEAVAALMGVDGRANFLKACGAINAAP